MKHISFYCNKVLKKLVEQKDGNKDDKKNKRDGSSTNV